MAEHIIAMLIIFKRPSLALTEINEIGGNPWNRDTCGSATRR
jgi:hypothetical protein